MRMIRDRMNGYEEKRESLREKEEKWKEKGKKKEKCRNERRVNKRKNFDRLRRFFHSTLFLGSAM